MNKKNIILVGGGGHCHACIDVIEQCGEFNIIGIVDACLPMDTEVCGYPVLGQDDDLPSLLSIADHALVTVGQLRSSELRERLYYMLGAIGYVLPSIISPLAYIARDVHIGAGSIVMHHAILNTKAKIGNNCIINTKALVEHDAVVFDHCHVSTGAIVNGGAKVGSQSFVGSASVVVHNVTVPEKSFIKANQLFIG
jgi:sugar O-acyltransferase (sialic acid O-acetyltransferase NeuD family)